MESSGDPSQGDPFFKPLLALRSSGSKRPLRIFIGFAAYLRTGEILSLKPEDVSLGRDRAVHTLSRRQKELRGSFSHWNGLKLLNSLPCVLLSPCSSCAREELLLGMDRDMSSCSCGILLYVNFGWKA